MPEPANLVDLFLWKETRKVDKAGCIQMSGNSYPVAEHLVRETVTVRFDPFDMSQIRVLHRGVFVGASAPLKLVCHTFRKALPDHVEKPAPLESSVAFRKQMSQGYRQKVDGVLEQARSTRAGSHDGLLTRAEFVTVVSEALENRSFSVIENNLLTDFFSQYAPLQKALVHQALLRAIEEKGSHRHVRFYLDAVRTGKRAHGGV